ncbi:hypothetical protein [Caenispirillum bisanense]|uniref:Uncharacterized protein n=1 Tax=Caenispirillum bisanense TaxID=414052 RepID=A0A286GY91_9PROT|nr:hypothetical protein [Caenispirillum bisanense]SOE00478.1 hypothetical protein SAMN05421508_112114 [Caenispirillum bisanense]
MAERQHSDIEAGRVRDQIDQGRTGDKIGQHDPAASPLGTDSEASGNRVSRSAAEADLREQRAAGGAGQQGTEHYGSRVQPHRRTPRRGGVMWGAILAVLAIAGLVLGFGLA